MTLLDGCVLGMALIVVTLFIIQVGLLLGIELGAGNEELEDGPALGFADVVG